MPPPCEINIPSSVCFVGSGITLCNSLWLEPFSNSKCCFYTALGITGFRPIQSCLCMLCLVSSFGFCWTFVRVSPTDQCNLCLDRCAMCYESSFVQLECSKVKATFLTAPMQVNSLSELCKSQRCAKTMFCLKYMETPGISSGGIYVVFEVLWQGF